MSDHLVFFDDECPFCRKTIQQIVEMDHQKQFLFAPLRGDTAETILVGPQSKYRSANSIVVAENYQSTGRRFWARSQAILRVYWLVGNGWGLLGIFSFLPSSLGDFLYNQFAAHRHQFKLKIPDALEPLDRFLP